MMAIGFIALITKAFSGANPVAPSDLLTHSQKTLPCYDAKKANLVSLHP